MNNVIFVGNRFGVLSEILKLPYRSLKIYSVASSFLSETLDQKKIPYVPLISRSKLIADLGSESYDLLISNGCPYILPISSLSKADRVFINIHPSLLPGLKGKHPVNGAILFGLPAGATCHYMVDTVDSGQIISQVSVGKLDNVSLSVGYELSFKAEAEAFLIGYKRNFLPVHLGMIKTKGSYYDRDEEDLRLNFSESLLKCYRRIKAFGVKSQGARFFVKNKKFIVYDCDIVSNPYLTKIGQKFKENQIVLVYSSGCLVYKEGKFLDLQQIDGDMSLLSVGQDLM